MSLINRMLDDLAARQAPGAESLSGVRLGDPMAEAQASLNTRKRWVLIAVALGAAALVWFLWPTRGQIPVPQPRGAVGESVAPAPPAAIASVPPAATIASPAIAGDGPAPEPFRPTLQLASSLEALRGTDSRAQPAARIEVRGDESVMIVDDAVAPEPEVPAPRVVARPPALRSATSISAPPEPLTRSERRGSRSNRREPAPLRPEAGIQAADARAPLNSPAAPTASRTDAARDALSRGDPAAALEALEPLGSDHNVEGAALRAAALQRLGRHREAADAYRGLTQGDPAEPGHWVGLAISLEGQQKREEARIAYRRALQSTQLAPSLRAFAQARVTVLEEP